MTARTSSISDQSAETSSAMGQRPAGQIGSGQIGSGQIGSGQIGSGQIGSGQVGSGPFNPSAVLAIALFGALAFFAMLYLIAIGATGDPSATGQAHAKSKGLNGYAALAEYLEEAGHDVQISRSNTALNEENLLILTPPHGADAQEIAGIIRQRRHIGPTLVIMPKWNAVSAARISKDDVPDGWVALEDAVTPRWADALAQEFASTNQKTPDSQSVFDVKIDSDEGAATFMDQQVQLPQSDLIQSLGKTDLVPLVTTPGGDALAGFVNDGGYYPTYEDAAGVHDLSDDTIDLWGVIIVAEPDLLNNAAFAKRANAQVAYNLVYTAMEHYDTDEAEFPIVFDVTLNGFGKSANLLTLAFTPPFLAATLCLMLAMVFVGWRAFLRFGPPLREGPAIAYGKSRLIANSARFILRTGRLHLLARPYAAMMRQRIVNALGHQQLDDQHLDRHVSHHIPDEPPVTSRLAAMDRARSRKDILRNAEALKRIERTLSP